MKRKAKTLMKPLWMNLNRFAARMMDDHDPDKAVGRFSRLLWRLKAPSLPSSET